MTSFQRIIKYIAIAFAVFLAINIFTAIIMALTIFVNIIDNVSDDRQDVTSSSYNDFSQTYQDINEINIEITASKFTILPGTEFKIEANSTNCSIAQKDKLLEVKDKFKFNNKASDITLYVPENITLEKLNFKAGAGDIQIKQLKVNKLNLELGAGNLSVENITVNKESKINGGVGKVVIDKSVLSNLNLDAGIGEFTITSTLIGDNDIDLGIGKFTLNLLGSDYEINAKKGLGSFTIDGDKINNDTTVGSGKQRVNIESGIGEVLVKYI